MPSAVVQLGLHNLRLNSPSGESTRTTSFAVISDSHNTHRQLNISPADVLIHW